MNFDIFSVSIDDYHKCYSLTTICTSTTALTNSRTNYNDSNVVTAVFTATTFITASRGAASNTIHSISITASAAFNGIASLL